MSEEFDPSPEATKGMQDVGGMPIQIQISADGKSIWINSIEGCIFRASHIPNLLLEDLRKK
jgi:hypothetical protein